MAAWLRLQRSDGLAWALPDAAPGRCETCRERPARASGYCSALCRLFDAALAQLLAARLDAEGDNAAAPVVVARTVLRAVAAVYDRDRLTRGHGDRITAGAAADWAADVAAGLLLPVDYAAAIAEVRRLAASG